MLQGMVAAGRDDAVVAHSAPSCCTGQQALTQRPGQVFNMQRNLGHRVGSGDVFVVHDEPVAFRRGHLHRLAIKCWRALALKCTQDMPQLIPGQHIQESGFHKHCDCLKNSILTLVLTDSKTLFFLMTRWQKSLPTS